MEVWWTGDLSYFPSFLPLKPLEVQQKSNGSPLDWPVQPVPMLFCFKMTSPDFDWTWTGQAVEFGPVQQIPLELARSGESLLETIGKGGGV